MGDMIIELYDDKTPVTVENFLRYVRDDFYDGTIFHRTVYGWLIQGGGYTGGYNGEELVARETRDPIKNEASRDLKHERGTIAMARFSDPDSADSQFFINLDDNSSFNHRGRTPDRYGYCVFGRVIEGMDVADAISAVEKKEKENFEVNFPAEPVLIEDVEILKE
jgi:cyclophilin family peptidyl-prolyl cis-trans isomerase